MKMTIAVILNVLRASFSHMASKVTLYNGARATTGQEPIRIAWDRAGEPGNGVARPEPG